MTMPSIASMPEGESFLALPIAEFQQALDALTPLRSEDPDDPYELGNIIAAGTSLVAMDRHTLGRWEMSPAVSMDGSFRASGIVFGDPFLIPEPVRVAIAGIRRRHLQVRAVRHTLTEHAVVLRRAAGFIDVSIRTAMGHTVRFAGELSVAGGEVREDQTMLRFSSSDGRIAPVQSILKAYPLIGNGAAAAPVVDPVTEFVAPTWPVQLDPAAVAKFSRYTKKHKPGTMKLSFTREGGHIHFQLGERFDGLMMPNTQKQYR